jgi:hypothetical protein
LPTAVQESGADQGGAIQEQTEYMDKCPSLANEIHDLFPALLMMEDIRPGKEDATGGEPGRSPIR